VIILNEIWQVRNFENISIENFKIANIYQRERQKGGGVLIYIRESLPFVKIESPILEGIIESVAISLNNNVFLGVYRPPAGNKQSFKEAIEKWISEQRNKNVYVAGDFNLNLLNNDKAVYESIEASTGLAPRISDITRVASNSCIDNILTNINGVHKISTICIADHQGLVSRLQIVIKREEITKHKYREMKESNWLVFSNEVKKLTIKGGSINEKWSNLCSDIKQIVEKSFPEKLSNKMYTFSMTQGLLKSKNKKNRLLKQFKRGEIEKEVYVRYNKIYRKLIVKEQEKSFNDKMKESGHDGKKKWRVLKTELKINQSREKIKSVHINNSVISNPNEIAIKFKEHFETCATKLASEVPDTGENEILFEQKPDWGFNVITEEKLIKTIDSLLPKSSCGFDLLSNRMLKKEKKDIAKLLLNLINETIMGDIFPMFSK